MFSSVSGISFYRYDDELEAKYLARRLMSYGIPPTGDVTTDKQLLKKVEAGAALQPVESTRRAETEMFTGGTEYSQNINPEHTALETERPGAEQLSLLMKLRLGLI